MIDRYTSPAIQQVFSQEAKLGYLLDAAVLAADVTAQEFKLDGGLALEVSRTRDLYRAVERSGKAGPWIEEWDKREAVYHHDIAAFVELVRARLPSEVAEYFHLGRTSSDLVDTALAIQLRDAKYFVTRAKDKLVRELAIKAMLYKDRTIPGMTHGQPAEVTSIGRRLAQFAATIAGTEMHAYDVAKLSGPVGVRATGTSQTVLQNRQLWQPFSTQVVPRYHLARVAAEMAAATVPLSDLAITIRLGSRNEGSSWCQEGRGGPDARGSSSMPTKTNPVRSERVSGLCARIRSAAYCLTEAVSGLWEERDISHSSVERITLPELYGLLEFVYTELADVVSRLSISGPGRAVMTTPAIALERLVVEAGLTYANAYDKVRREGPMAAQLDVGILDFNEIRYDPGAEPGLWNAMARYAK